MVESINFVEDSWHYLSPFSAHEVEIDGKVYKTAEHAYYVCIENFMTDKRPSLLFQ